MERGRRVRDSQWDASTAGCRGVSPFVERLPYVSLGTLFPLPIGHLMLLGLIKSFWGLALTKVKRGQPRPLYVLPNATRRELTRRCGHFRVTADFGRDARCGRHHCGAAGGLC